MKRTKAEKGITLVALIITIIVLLILAAVAISAVRNDGIIEYAKNARNEYEKAQSEEGTILGYYTNKIKESTEEVKLINFKIGEMSFEAIDGMTWGDWLNSKYNTIGAVLEEEDNSTDVYIKVILDNKEQYVYWKSMSGSGSGAAGGGGAASPTLTIHDYSENIYADSNNGYYSYTIYYFGERPVGEDL